MTATATPEILTFLYEPKPGIRRMLKVRTPDEGVLSVWAASGERFQTLGDEWAAAEQALVGKTDDDPDVLEFRAMRSQQAQRALKRGLKIVGAALVEEADRDWLEDCLLDQKFKLAEALGILSAAVEELKRQKTAQGPQAPTNGPVTARRI